MADSPAEIHIDDLAEPVLDERQKAVLAATRDIEVTFSE